MDNPIRKKTAKNELLTSFIIKYLGYYFKLKYIY